MSNLHHFPRPGLTEESFRRFEPIICEACKSYPQPVNVPIPEGLSPNTITGRLRDAISSLKRFNWPVSWNVTNLSKLQVFQTEYGVFVNKPNTAPITKLTFQPTNVLTPNHAQLQALCLLIDAEIIQTKGILISFDSLSLDPSYYSNSFNVALVPSDIEGVYVLT